MVKRLPVRFGSNNKKVVLQFFYPGSKERTLKVVSRVHGMSKTEKEKFLEESIALFSKRHKDYDRLLADNFRKLKEIVSTDIPYDSVEGRLLAAYFSKEYSTQSAALFNPSIVRHPVQDPSDPGKLRFVLSLRATGESHISSIAFREGTISKNGSVELEDDSPFCVSPVSKMPFAHERFRGDGELTDANYDIVFSGEESITERIIFPSSPAESNGIEDVRFAEFTDDDNSKIYLGTYTAYNGKRIFPQLIETKDFRHFSIRTLQGKAAVDKGMAIFPRRINGKYVICSRIDGENLYIMSSDDLYTWEKATVLRQPYLPWEFVQIGNCGSPIETDEGWLLLTHAVGFFRRYVISAVLLDKENPEKVIGALDVPLISPDETEREGYVPNVVYSCGSMQYGDTLFIPYAMSDSVSGMATCRMQDILNNMKSL